MPQIKKDPYKSATTVSVASAFPIPKDEQRESKYPLCAFARPYPFRGKKRSEASQKKNHFRVGGSPFSYDLYTEAQQKTYFELYSNPKNKR